MSVTIAVFKYAGDFSQVTEAKIKEKWNAVLEDGCVMLPETVTLYFEQIPVESLYDLGVNIKDDADGEEKDVSSDEDDETSDEDVDAGQVSDDDGFPR